MRNLKPIAVGAFWIVAYLVLVISPLIGLLLLPTPPGRGFLVDFSVALGFAGAAMLAIQFLLTARFRRATAPFGIDIVYYFHRYAAVLGFSLLLAHPVLLIFDSPEMLGQMSPLRASWAMLAGEISLLALAGLVGLSVARKQLRLHYDAWRIWHVLLSGCAVVFALAHMQGAAYYATSPWTRALWAVIFASALGVIVFVRIIKPAILLRRPWRVVEVREELPDVLTLVLRADGHAGMSFAPGQFVWLTLRSSPFAMREHPFSIASSPSDPTTIELTIKELGDFTRTIRGVSPGAIAYLEGPHGSFSIDRHPAPAYLFVAGGIGIVPILCMLRTLRDRGDKRPLTLVYCTSEWARTPFTQELAGLADTLSLTLVHVLEHPAEGWTGARGRPDAALLRQHLPEDCEAMECFICGPTSMMDAVERALHSLGVPMTRIRSELFNLV